MDKNFFLFTTVDYIVFIAMLVFSALLGVYYGYFHRRNSLQTQNASDGRELSEYLQGGKKMKPLPVAMSLVAGYISSVTIIGTPTEIYNFGTQYWLIVLAIWLSGTLVAYVYLPVFYKLQVNSSYEYLEMRFSRGVRIMGSVLFVIDEILYLPIVIYVPSLTFNQVTGFDLHIIAIVTCLICIFYTVTGGLNAVVYTDALQIIIMSLSVIVVVIVGLVSLGGSSVVWQRNKEGRRVIFGNFNPSLYERHTVFSVVIGGVFYWTAFNSVNQTMVQRYLSLPTEKISRLAIVCFSIGISVFISFCVYTGVLLYAAYHKCDPLSSGRIHQDDQMLSLFVMEYAGHLRGIPGLFMAGVFGAALSTLSVMLHSTSTSILEDFIQSYMNIQLQEKTATFVVKIVILALGVLSIGLLYLVEHMTGILAGATAVSAIATGTTFGIFNLGMLVPWANSIGTIVGAVVGTITSGILAFGSQYVMAAGYVVPHKLPVNIDKCDKYDIHANLTVEDYPDESQVFPLFRITFLWIAPWGMLITMLVGTIVSFATGKTDLKGLDPEVISPVCRWMLPQEAQRNVGSAARRVQEEE